MADREIGDLSYEPMVLRDVVVILKIAPYIDQLNEKETKNVMAWLNSNYCDKKDGESDE